MRPVLRSPAAPTRHSRRIWPTLAVLTAATFWTVTAEMLPSGVLPPMSRDLAVSESAIGMLVSAWAITIAVASIPLVRLTLRLPRTMLISLSLAVMAPANLLTALAPNFTVALIGRILAATAHGLFWALVVTYVASLVDPARLGRALSVVLAGPAFAGLLGLPTAAFIAEHAGWRTVFIGLSVVFAVTGAVLWLILPTGDDPSTTSPETGTWDRSAHRVVMVAIAGGLVLIGHFAAFTFVAPLITDFAGLGRAAVPAVLLVLGITGAVGVAVSGFASDHYPRAAVVLAAAGIVMGLTVLIPGQGHPGIFLTGIALWGLAVGAFPPILQARVLRLASPSFRPLAGSTVVTVLNLGIAAGAALGGVVLREGHLSLVVLAVLSATAGAVGLAMHRHT